MPLAMLGRKIGMTQRFDEEGRIIPVTVLEMPPCPIVQKKSVETDGYNAIQIGFGRRKKSRLNKPWAGHFRRSGVEPTRMLKEIRLTEEEAAQFEVGGLVTLDLFEKGDRVNVTGESKGKGFAGVMKRYNFAGKNRTHGTHEFFRHGGSIGQCASPGRLFKGRKMPGRLGGVRTTMQRLLVVDVKKEQNLLFIRGGVPGGRNGTVLVRKVLGKRKGHPSARA